MADQDKTEQPTEKRIRDTREEGNVFQSRDVVTVAVLLVVTMIIRAMLPRIENELHIFLNHVMTLIGGDPAEMISRQLFLEFIRTAAICALPAAVVAAVVEILAAGVQTRFNFSQKAARPKFSRLNPANGIKRVFSLRGLMGLLKNIVKIIILFYFAFTMIRDDIIPIARTMDMPVAQGASELFSLMYDLIIRIIMAFAVIAAVDYMFERRQYTKDLMMTKQEVKEEYKMTEGNPEIKGRIKRKQREIAQRRMMQQVPQADVVVRNPTHYAVALKYEPHKMAAPVVLGKGVDSLALRIVRVAEDNDVPCIENVALARSLYSACEINEVIPAEFYGVVAELLVFIYRQQNREDLLY